MKKIVSVILTVTLLASLLAACGSKAPAETTAETTAEPTTEAVTEVTTEAATESTETVSETTEITETTAAAAEYTQESLDALSMLENIWADYAEEEKFPIGGGDSVNFTMNEPGAVDMANAEGLSYNLLIPAEKLADVNGAATMVHMMNGNTFTSGLIHMTEGADLTAFAAELKDIIKNNPFVCGFPEKMLLATIGEYLLISYGNGEIMDIFQGHVENVYPETVVLHTDSII